MESILNTVEIKKFWSNDFVKLVAVTRGASMPASELPQRIVIKEAAGPRAWTFLDACLVISHFRRF